MHITTSLNIGGLETFLLELLRHTDRSRYTPYVCTMTANGQLISEFKALDVPVTVLPQRIGVDYMMPFRLASAFRRFRIDLVHTHNVYPWFYGLIAAKMARVRGIVHTEHSNVASNQKKLFYLEKYLSFFTDMIIGDSATVSSHLVYQQGIQKKKVVTIFNGINERNYQNRFDRSETRAQLGISADAVVIGTVGRLVPVKNHLGLLRSFSVVKRKFEKVKLLIVGDGELRKHLETYVQELDARDDVHFLGFRRDIPALLKAIDIFVLFSFSEGLSISLLEAMASGLAIVASDVGGNREAIGNNEAGLLVKPGSDKELAQALIFLLTHPEHLMEKARHARLRVKNFFSISKTVHSYENVYHQILSTNSGGKTRI